MSNFTMDMPEDDEFHLDEESFTAPAPTADPARQQPGRSGISSLLQQQATSQGMHAQPDQGNNRQTTSQGIPAQNQATSQSMNRKQLEEQYAAGWKPANTETKFNHKELNSIKSSKEYSTLAGGRSQDRSRISVGTSAVSPEQCQQSESTKLGRDTVSAIRAMAEAQEVMQKPEPDGIIAKLKKLLKR